jgi:hypothetical protein
MKTASQMGFFSEKDLSTREGRFAADLATTLDARGNIIRRGDFQVIQRAFERHFKICLKDFVEAEHKQRRCA